MIRKLNGAITIYVVILFAAFAIVSLMVVLTNGNQYFLMKKLRIGGLIIGLTGVAMTGTACPPMCYDAPGQISYLDIDDVGSDNRVTIDLAGDRTIRGTVYETTTYRYAYVVYQTSRDVDGITGEVEAIDGAFDEPTEEYQIVLSNVIEPGEYTLEFFEVADWGETYLTPSFTLIVTDSRE